MSKKNKIKRKFTKTATFLFPLLEVPKYTFKCNITNSFNKPLYDSRFINAYLHDEALGYQDEDYIYLLLENYQDENFKKFYSTLSTFPNYVDDYESNNYLIVIYSIPEKNKDDYNLILDGKYSEISDDAKLLIISNYYYHGAKMTLSLILHKSNILKETWEKELSFTATGVNSPADLKDQEVWSKIMRSEQILTKEIFTELKLLKKLTPSQEFDEI
jgi:hypothetical protein